jgi:hypothetical protein
MYRFALQSREPTPLSALGSVSGIEDSDLERHTRDVPMQLRLDERAASETGVANEFVAAMKQPIGG